MSGSDQTRTITGWRQVSRYYRRSPGPGWLVALLVIPLLLGLLGWVMLPKESVEVTRPDVSPTLTVPTTAPDVGAPTLSWSAISLLRNGNDITLSGSVPTEAARTSFIDGVRGLFGPDVNVVDNLTVTDGVSIPDLSAVGAALNPGLDIPDYAWKAEGDTVTLTGTAPSEDVRAAAESAVSAAWPDAKIDNQIRVTGATAPAESNRCADVQAEINELLRTPIQFDTNGSSVAAVSRQMLGEVANSIKECPDAMVEVSGHTDSTGSDAINQPLSENRARAVADFLISQGIAADNVTSQGFGSSNPIASNDTPEGQAQNRRVEIAVS